MLTSRRELVEWLCSLDIQINKIEEIGQGTAICKLLSIIHSNTKFSYIKKPITTYEYLRNLKTAQTFFQENKIDVRFPIEKLVQCKLQDNLEFAQWMYKYYCKHNNDVYKIDNKSKNNKSIDTNNNKSNNNKSIDTNNNKVEYDNNESIDMNNNKVEYDNNELIDMNNNKYYMSEERNKNRQEILENIKKHYEDQNNKLQDKYILQCEENKRLINLIRIQEVELENLKSKTNLNDDSHIKNFVLEIEKGRDFYFSILVDLEKYILECSEVNENVKKEILNLLYRKI